LPLVGAFSAALVIFGLAQAPDAPRPATFAWSLVAVQMHYVLSRPDGSHFFATLPALSLALLLAVDSLPSRKVPSTLTIVLTVVAIVIPATYSAKVIVANAVAQLPGLRALPETLIGDDALESDACGRPCLAFVNDPDARKAARYVRERTTRNEPVLSAPARHLEAYSNDMHLYWLLRRPAGSHHIMMMHGVSTPPAQEKLIVSDLEARDVSWVVLWDGERLQGVTSVGTSAVDEYIVAHFQLEETFGAYGVHRRRR
jgi:hypothetical protein